MAPDPTGSSVPPLASFPKAEAPAYRSPLPSYWGGYIEGDFPGLYILAEQLYKFAEAGNPSVDRLRREVNTLIGDRDDQSDSESLRLFKRKFGQNAVIMTALNRTASAAAAVIDRLGITLAQIEHDFDQRVDEGVSAGYWLQNVQATSNGFPQPQPDGRFQDEYRALQRFYLEKQGAAKRARLLAAKEMTTLAQILGQGLNFFKGQSNISGALPANQLLSPGQAAWYGPRIDKLLKELQDESKDDKSGLTVGDVSDDLKKIGGGAQSVGGVLDKIPPLKPVGKGVGEFGTILNDLGGLLEIFK
ncbi:hypothetical protein J4573_09235 [Actinomadura barringtoniae]|uniref:Uncharacterized protein n=1 Tax=Actinomadura barringtoniae TaxID=1427535 RepID=A0A939P7N9_9ACTN|nr:hypothetical protein [Actinomadura barringtoniae]MBO2447266.1 hypothetical protein [Actinomadura barringtoniae]